MAKIIGNDAVIAIANGEHHAEITVAERAMIEFGRQVARDASKIKADNIDRLREFHGFSDEEIFDIAAIAASRSFFTKLLDALGSVADQSFMKIDPDLRRALTVGRPISSVPPEYLEDDRAA